MDVECSLWGIGASTMTDLTITLRFSHAPNCPKIHTHPHRWNIVRVHPYAHPHHIKVLKHFVYI